MVFIKALLQANFVGKPAGWKGDLRAKAGPGRMGTRTATAGGGGGEQPEDHLQQLPRVGEASAGREVVCHLAGNAGERDPCSNAVLGHSSFPASASRGCGMSSVRAFSCPMHNQSTIGQRLVDWHGD